MAGIIVSMLLRALALGLDLADQPKDLVSEPLNLSC